MTKRYFATLTTQEALHVALLIEARNARIYQQFAELFGSFSDQDSQAIAAVFTEMAEEEEAHGAELQARYVARYGEAECDVTPDDVQDLVELPRVPDGSIFAIARAGAATAPRTQALAIALATEEGALRFYVRMAETTDDPELNLLYQELGRFEGEHVYELRKRITQARNSVNNDL
jgi:rubrerythrin